jgi:heme-degrading monooxygenase HmoA
MDGGWRVITVWDSDEQFQQFRSEKLIPAIQAQGRGDAVAPRIDSQPVHRHLTA